MIRQFFQIYPGEGKRTLLFLLLSLFWSFAIFCGLTLSEALFILHVGATELPTAYMLTACGMLTVSGLILYGTHIFNSQRMFFFAFGGITFYFLSFAVALFVNTTPPLSFWYGTKVLSYMSFLVANLAFWNFVENYHDLQDGKRIYSFYNAVTFFGQALAGALIGLSWFSLQNLLFLIIAVLSATLLMALVVLRQLPIVYDDTVDETEEHHLGTLAPLLKNILHSPFTLLLLLNWLTLQILNSVTDYSVLSAFEFHFSDASGWQTERAAEANLTVFMGRCLAATSIGALLFGAVVYPRIIRRAGLNNVMLLLPLFYISAYLGWSISYSLVAAVFAFFLLEGLIDTCDDNNYNLLISSVPGRIRQHVRVAIDSFVEPIGMLLGAGLLTLAGSYSLQAGGLLALFSLLLFLALRARYLDALMANVRETTIHFGRTVHNWMQDLSSVERAENMRSLAKYRDGTDAELSELAANTLETINNWQSPSEPSSLPAAQLIEAVANRRLPFHERLKACRQTSILYPHSLEKALPGIFQAEIHHAAFLFLHGHHLKTEEHLSEALLSESRSSLDFTIQLLGIAHSIEQAELLVHAIHSRNRKSASHAVEALEKACDRKLFYQLAPLVDLDAPIEAKLAYCQQITSAPFLLEELLDQLAFSPAPALIIAAVHLKKERSLPGWKQRATELLDHKLPLLQHFAKELLV